MKTKSTTTLEGLIILLSILLASFQASASGPSLPGPGSTNELAPTYPQIYVVGHASPNGTLPWGAFVLTSPPSGFDTNGYITNGPFKVRAELHNIWTRTNRLNCGEVLYASWPFAAETNTNWTAFSGWTVQSNSGVLITNTFAIEMPTNWGTAAAGFSPLEIESNIYCLCFDTQPTNECLCDNPPPQLPPNIDPPAEPDPNFPPTPCDQCGVPPTSPFTPPPDTKVSDLLPQSFHYFTQSLIGIPGNYYQPQIVRALGGSFADFDGTNQFLLVYDPSRSTSNLVTTNQVFISDTNSHSRNFVFYWYSTNAAEFFQFRTLGQTNTGGGVFNP
jgi:hypothetical protein